MNRRASHSPLVPPSWLATHLGDADLRVVDVRWYLDGRSGRAAYDGGHIPGAVWMDLDADLAGPKGPGLAGRHPLPDAASFARSLASVGIGSLTRVVAYDDDGGAKAARLWWLLRYFGHPVPALVLDGGLAGWTSDGHALETKSTVIRPATPPVLSPGHAKVLRKDDMRDLTGALLLDARGPDRYEGKSEPIDARPGHIPGALNAPYAQNLHTETGRFLPEAELRARYDALGAKAGSRVVVYCGSGVTACHDILALSLLGIDAELYEGSWSEWSADPTLPARLGKEP